MTILTIAFALGLWCAEVFYQADVPLATYAFVVVAGFFADVALYRIESAR